MPSSTRIRYSTSDSKMTSKQSFLANEGKLLSVEIDVPSLTVSVLEGSTVVAANQCKSVAACKVKAKKMLQTYGVTFYEEVRKKPVTNE